MGAGADGGFVVFLLTGCDRNPWADAREGWIRPPAPMCAEGSAGTATAAWMIRTDRLRSCPAGSRTLPIGLGRARGALAERKEFLRTGRAGLSQLCGAVPQVRDQP